MSRAVAALIAESTQATATRTATGTQPEAPGPAMAAAIVGENPPIAKPIWVPMAMPDSRTLVENISP